jgi:hypothetical protein
MTDSSPPLLPPAPWLTPPRQQLLGWILASHQRAWHRPLLAGLAGATPLQAAQEVFAAATVLLAHDGAPDPRLIYANAAALRLWSRPWGEMVGMPSRLTAEPQERRARAGALAEARRQGAIGAYGGVRVDSRGRRFRIQGARLWTFWNDRGEAVGQAACFESWWWI